MPLRSTWKVQTIALAYRDICQGQMPWVALGNFMNEWFDYSLDSRESLIIDELPIPEQETQETLQWAAFCAAAVEYLCEQYQVSCPAWVDHPKYVLPEKWLAVEHPELLSTRGRDHRITTTPATFAKRNIYCGDRVFANKYEFAKAFRERKIAPQSL